MDFDEIGVIYPEIDLLKNTQIMEKSLRLDGYINLIGEYRRIIFMNLSSVEMIQ